MSVSNTFAPDHSPAFAELVASDKARQSLSPEEVARTQSEYEKAVVERSMAIAREFIGQDISRLDLNVPGIVKDGERYRNVGSSPGEYMTSAGLVRVERTVYELRGGHGGQTCVPMELRLGLVDGYWTGRAAQLGCSYMAANPSREAAELLNEAGVMSPSAGQLDRLPKHFNVLWEQTRDALLAEVREMDELPEPDRVALIGVSLDGIMLPMKDAPRDNSESNQTRGARGHKEVGCGSVSLYDETGERLSTLRFGRMPESKKVTLKEQLKAEVARLEESYPSARVEGVADGAKENWRILEELDRELNLEMEFVLDFWHALEHVATALMIVFSDSPDQVKAELERWHQALIKDEYAVDQLIELLQAGVERKRGKPREELETEVNYFIGHKERMRYPELLSRGRPIGSGVQEAACKTLVTERMKRSGMSWRLRGGQGILTLRSLKQSNRFVGAWNALEPRLRQTFHIDPDGTRKRPARLDLGKV